jgi:hypothetical protein
MWSGFIWLKVEPRNVHNYQLLKQLCKMELVKHSVISVPDVKVI